MDWNLPTVLTLISAMTAAICSILRVLQGATENNVNNNTEVTREAAHTNALAVAHAETAAANAMLAASTSAAAQKRIEDVATQISNGGH